MTEGFKSPTQENRLYQLNGLIRAGIEAKNKYFLQEGENSDYNEVKLKMTREMLQTLMVKNKSITASSQNKYQENSLTHFRLPENDWNDFVNDQLAAFTDLRKANSALYKNSPPPNSGDWKNLNQQETEIKVKVKTAKSLIQILAGFMELEDLRALTLKDQGGKKYCEHLIAKDKKIKGLRNLLSQLEEQGLPVKKSEVVTLEAIIAFNKLDVEMAKSILEKKAY